MTQCTAELFLNNVNNRAAFQIADDREVGMFRLSVPDVDFVNADRPDFRCVNCCKSLLKMPLLNVLYSMPSQMKVVRQCQHHSRSIPG